MRRKSPRITIELPAALLDDLKAEAKRLGMTPQKLIVSILKNHRSAGRNEELVTLAIAQSAGKFKTGRYER